MATLRELIIKISANSQSFQTEIARASRTGSDYYKTMQTGGRQAAAATRETQRSLAELNSQLATVKSSAVGLAGAWAGAFATGHLISLADQWSSVNARLKQASRSTDDFNGSQRALMEISQRTGTAFSDNAGLFARSAASMREYGYSSGDVLKVTEAISTGLKLSGASSSEASSVITQFSQALAQGVLRGEEFNSVNENGDRVIRALASGMGVAREDLKAMADQGQLTADKVVPALISQLSVLRREYGEMPQTVQASVTKIENAFLAWVGGANEASGATQALSGVLSGIADNIDEVATAAGVLAAVGVSRFVGGMLGDISSQTGKLLDARKTEIVLASARAESAVQLQRKAAADAIAAERAYQLAQAELTLARNTNAEAIAIQNATAKRSAMITANASLVQSNRAVAASQTALNAATSAMGMVKSGAAGLLGLVGGLPGLLMLGAWAWYTIYQNQEQARASAREYADQIDVINDKTAKMSLPEVKDNHQKAAEALTEQNRLIEEQAQKVAQVRRQIEDLNKARSNPALNDNNRENIDKALTLSTGELRAEEERLFQLRNKAATIQQTLDGLQTHYNDLIRDQAWRQNEAYQSLLMMNGQHSEFNRLLGLGNMLLATRQGLGVVPMMMDQNPVSEKDQRTLTGKQQQAELSGLSGLERVNKQADFDLASMGRNGPQDAVYARQYRQAMVEEYQNTQRLNQARKNATSSLSAQQKAEREAASTAEQYSRKIADLSIAIEVQKVRAEQGEKAANLFAASHENGVKWTDEQRRAIAASAVELAKWTQKADDAVKKHEEMRDALTDLLDAARKYNDEAARTRETAGMGSRAREKYGEEQEVERIFDKSDKGAKAVVARSTALDALNRKYAEAKAAEQDWLAGVSGGLADWVDNASDYASQAAQVTQGAMDGMVNNITDMLNGNKASWRDWALDVIKSIEKILVNAAIVNSLKSLSGAMSGGGGVWGTIGGWISNAVANEKGGVYSSPGLSAYSNSIVDTPTYFAFAKGAGLMGEAGPEAIMPLARSADGSLGVRAVKQSASAGSGTVYAPVNNFVINNDGVNGQLGPQALGAVYNIARKAAQDVFRQQMRDGGMLAGG
ncbi:phage tail tape measure protein [Citrobacter meridianamericanus]|uniref:phage tail tape measure protein n=1 Tax=Citrobacter meridianamericanus TaxID=2894201 RepID=UPI00351CC807